MCLLQKTWPPVSLLPQKNRAVLRPASIRRKKVEVTRQLIISLEGSFDWISCDPTLGHFICPPLQWYPSLCDLTIEWPIQKGRLTWAARLPLSQVSQRTYPIEMRYEERTQRGKVGRKDSPSSFAYPRYRTGVPRHRSTSVPPLFESLFILRLLSIDVNSDRAKLTSKRYTEDSVCRLSRPCQVVALWTI